MRILALIAVLSLPACGGPPVLKASPAAVVEVSLKVTNRANQAVTVFVFVAGGTEQQVGAPVPKGQTEILPVPGVASGSTVRLRALLADGSRSYTREGVQLKGVYEWQVP